MKTKITLLTISVALLLTACGQVQSSPTETPLSLSPAVQEETRQPQPTPEPTTTAHEPHAVPITTQEQSQKENTHQEENIPQTANPPEPIEEPPEEIPSETVHAKAGYVEPEPTPEPEPPPTPSIPADRQAAIDAANAYAVTQYDVTTDTSLTLDTSAYRFPAVVPVEASRETLEAKAQDMVDFTFRQLMMQAGRDNIADAGFRCNVCIIENGDSLLLYVLYDG